LPSLRFFVFLKDGLILLRVFVNQLWLRSFFILNRYYSHDACLSHPVLVSFSPAFERWVHFAASLCQLFLILFVFLFKMYITVFMLVFVNLFWIRCVFSFVDECYRFDAYPCQYFLPSLRFSLFWKMVLFCCLSLSIFFDFLCFSFLNGN
jgi:hypothetical protein